jgi:hypothetical protein
MSSWPPYGLEKEFLQFQCQDVFLPFFLPVVESQLTALEWCRIEKWPPSYVWDPDFHYKWKF